MDELFSDCEIDLKNPMSNSLMPVSEEELLRKEDIGSQDESPDSLEEDPDIPALSNNLEDSSLSSSDSNQDSLNDTKQEKPAISKVKDEVAAGVGVPEPVA